MTTIKMQGITVGTCKTANRGNMKGYCGQKLQEGLYACYIPSIGIVAVEKGEKPEIVNIINILWDINDIKKQILTSFKNSKKLAIAVERNDYISFLEIPVNLKTIDAILPCLQLNTTHDKEWKWYKTGVIFRDVKESYEKLSAIGVEVLNFPVTDFEKIAEKFQNSSANNGNFMEFLLSGKNEDIVDRFRRKSVDAYVKLDDYKSIRRWELKTSLKYVNKARNSSASSTNFLAYIKNNID